MKGLEPKDVTLTLPRTCKAPRTPSPQTAILSITDRKLPQEYVHHAYLAQGLLTTFALFQKSDQEYE